jgi:hypothetical protein
MVGNRGDGNRGRGWPCFLFFLLVGCSSSGGARSVPTGSASGAGGGSTAGSPGGTGAAGSTGIDGGGQAGSGGTLDAGFLLADGGAFIDPVPGSEGDQTLQGTDSDNDGVRDDLEAFIPTLETDPRKQTALLSFARESTAMMVLGGTAGTTNGAAVAQAQRVGRTIDCLYDLYAPDNATRTDILFKIRSGLYDNALRLGAYNHASTLVSGSIFDMGHGCDSAITGVSQ